MEKNVNNNATGKNPGNASQANSSIADKVGETLEKAGHKISEAGMPSIGQKIHDLGDKVEKNHSDPSHPHDV